MMTYKVKFSAMTDELILNNSYGQVTNDRTFNFKYKNPKPTPGGLYAEEIFGPEKDYVCGCGEYLRPLEGDQVKCSVCHVDHVLSKERVDRFGHIDLNTYVVMPYTAPILARLFKVDIKFFEKFLLGKYYGVTEEFQDGPIKCINGKEYRLVLFPYNSRKAEIKQACEQANGIRGANSLYNRLKDIGISESKTMSSSAGPAKLYFTKGYALFDLFNRLMPVLPAGMREVNYVDNKAELPPETSVYARIVKYSNQILGLKQKLAEDESITPTTVAKLEELTSLLIQGKIFELIRTGLTIGNQRVEPVSKTLIGKGGLLRGNLLGKRMDFTGRTSLSTGPDLRVDEMGIPYGMLKELFLVHLISLFYRRLKKNADKYTSRSELISKAIRIVNSSDCKEEIDYLARRNTVLMNRAPSLHRYSVMSFKIKPLETKCYRMPPVAMAPFNADCLLGDQKIHTLKYGFVTVPELIEKANGDKTFSFEVWSRDSKGDMVIGIGHSPRLIRYATSYYEVHLDNRKQVKCTSNHLFLLSDGVTYKAADELEIGEEVSSLVYDESGQASQSEKAVKVAKVSIEQEYEIINDQAVIKKVPVYDITVDEYHNHALEAGVFCHQCDGDTLAVHLQISKNAQKEYGRHGFAHNLMSTENLNTPNVTFSHEAVVASYVLTRDILKIQDKPVAAYGEVDDLIQRYELGVLKKHDRIRTKFKNIPLDTSIGNLLVCNAIGMINETVLDKKGIKKLSTAICNSYPDDTAVEPLSNLMHLLFRESTKIGISVCTADCQKSDRTRRRLAHAAKKAVTRKGMARAKIWDKAINRSTREWWESADPDNSLILMGKSGARVTDGQVRQMIIAKGLLTTMTDDLMVDAVPNSLTDGLSPIDYFKSAGPARRGMANNHFIVPATGYLERQLVTACRDLFIHSHDCGVERGIVLSRKDAIGRYTIDRELILPSNYLDFPEEVEVLSPITCKDTDGLCQHCCGTRPSDFRLWPGGTGIGVITAQTLTQGLFQAGLRGKHLSGSTTVKDFQNKLTDTVANVIAIMKARGTADTDIPVVDWPKYSLEEDLSQVYWLCSEMKREFDIAGFSNYHVYYEIIARALTNLTYNDSKKLVLRSNYPTDIIPPMRGVMDVNTRHPNTLRNLGFGYVNAQLCRAVAEMQTSIFGQTEKLLSGDKIGWSAGDDIRKL